MAFNTQFVVDQVKVYPEIHKFTNGISLIRAHWIITNTDHPDGAAHHVFEKSFSHDSFTLETFVPVEDVTDAMMEEWVTSSIAADTIQKIKMAALERIRFTHEEAQMTTYFENSGG
jgi:hypothetical protein